MELGDSALGWEIMEPTPQHEAPQDSATVLRGVLWKRMRFGDHRHVCQTSC